MKISNRASVLIIIAAIVLLILFGIWIVHITSNLRIEPKNYDVDKNIGDKIDTVVDYGSEGLNEVSGNEVVSNEIKSNSIQSNDIVSNEL